MGHFQHAQNAKCDGNVSDMMMQQQPDLLSRVIRLINGVDNFIVVQSPIDNIDADLLFQLAPVGDSVNFNALIADVLSLEPEYLDHDETIFSVQPANLKTLKQVTEYKNTELYIKTSSLKNNEVVLFLLFKHQTLSQELDAVECIALLEQLFGNLQCNLSSDNNHADSAELDSLINLGRMVPSITHEINNPLGVALTSVSHLESCLQDINRSFENGELTENSFKEFIDESGEAVELLEFNIERAVGLIRDFKSNAVNQSSDSLTHFNLLKQINSIINSVQPRLRAKQVTLNTNINIEPELVIKSYPGVLFQIFANLIFNALNHAFDGQSSQQVTVAISHNDKELNIDIRDNGKGIAPENIQSIFKPYFTTKKGAGGSGLGLSVVKSLIEDKLRGAIKVESKIEQGTVFTITVPLSFENAHEPN